MIGRVGTRRLIRTFGAPRRITTRAHSRAAKDLVVRRQRSIAVRIEADDDLALGTLRLKYTQGVRRRRAFHVLEGEIPLLSASPRAREWESRAFIALAPLLQEAGDLVVYRAVVTDHVPAPSRSSRTRTSPNSWHPAGWRHSASRSIPTRIATRSASRW